jgi:hypothetical protein
MGAARQARSTTFTAGEYAARMVRVVDDAVEQGLDGVVVAPGPDLVWLTGYRPTAITERLTLRSRWSTGPTAPTPMTPWRRS